MYCYNAISLKREFGKDAKVARKVLAVDGLGGVMDGKHEFMTL